MELYCLVDGLNAIFILISERGINESVYFFFLSALEYGSFFSDFTLLTFISFHSLKTMVTK
jgi:hypothetical protein